MRRLSRRAVALIAGVGAAVVALAVTGTVLASPTGEVASLDGHAVTRDELLFHMRRLAPAGTERVAQPGRPARRRSTSRSHDDRRRDRARAARGPRARRDPAGQATLVLAEEDGLDRLPSTTQDFLAELAEENERRATDASPG